MYIYSFVMGLLLCIQVFLRKMLGTRYGSVGTRSI